MVKNLSNSAGLGASDHVTLEFELSCYLMYRPSGSRLDFGCGNFELLNSMLFNVDWDQLQELEFLVVMHSSRKMFMNALGKPFPCHGPPTRRRIFTLTEKLFRLERRKSTSGDNTYNQKI